MAVYGQLDSTEDVDVLRLDFDEPTEEWLLHILIPTCHNDFNPTVALIGPGDDTSDTLPFDLPKGMEAALYESYQERPITTSFFEQDFRQSPNYSLDFEIAGTYYLAIWEPDGNIGAYTLATGNEHPDSLIWTNEKDDALQSVLNNRWWSMGCN